MNGRMENRIKTETVINDLLKTLPGYVTNYYYNISVSLEPKTCLEYVKTVKRLLNFVENKEITTISEMDIARFMHSIEIKKNAKGELSQTSFSYRKTAYSVLNNFFSYMYKTKIIAQNPMECISRPKNTDSVRRPHLTSEDFKKILAQVEIGGGSQRATNCQKKWKSRDIAIFMLFMTTGMRETALTEINVGDVDFENGFITVIDKRYKTHVYRIKGKVENALKTWLFDRERLLGGKECDALFISNRKTRINEDSVSEIVKKYTKDALGYAISPHKIRSAFCTILYEQTGDIEFVRDAVGHSNVATTQRYIVKDGMAKTKAANIMNDII